MNPLVLGASSPLLRSCLEEGGDAIVLPDYSTSTIALLLAFLTTGPVMIPMGLMEELGQLAAVLELKIDYTAALADSRSVDLVRVWRSGAGLVLHGGLLTLEPRTC